MSSQHLFPILTPITQNPENRETRTIRGKRRESSNSTFLIFNPSLLFFSPSQEEKIENKLQQRKF